MGFCEARMLAARKTHLPWPLRQLAICVGFLTVSVAGQYSCVWPTRNSDGTARGISWSSQPSVPFGPSCIDTTSKGACYFNHGSDSSRCSAAAPTYSSASRVSCPAGWYGNALAKCEATVSCTYTYTSSGCFITFQYDKCINNGVSTSVVLYSNSYSAYCMPCPAGTYGNTTGSSPASCARRSCPTGSYCPAGATAPIQCPAGTYGNTSNLTTASCSALCPAGYYCLAGTIQPALLCTAGFYCPEGSPSPTACPTDAYCDGSSMPIYSCVWPTSNANGSASGLNWSSFPRTPLAGGLACTDTTRGCFSLSSSCYSRLSPSSCRAPTASTSLKANVICPAGWYGNASATCRAALTCLYNMKSGKCGRFGSGDCNETCTEGSVNRTLVISKTSLDLCTQCPLGSFCPAGAVGPTLCPAGTFGATKGLSDSACSGPCSAGYFCSAGSIVSTASSCPCCAAGSSSGISCSKSPTQTPSSTRSGTRSGTQALSAGASDSQTNTQFPTTSATTSQSSTPSSSVSLTASQSTTTSQSASTTTSSSQSASDTSSSSQSSSDSCSATQSGTSSTSSSGSASMSPTISGTASLSQSGSSSASQTLTQTMSSSQSLSPSQSASQMQTPSVTKTHSVSQTLTPSQTQTHSPNPTQSVSPSLTRSQLQTLSSTETASQTQSPSQAQTPSPSTTWSQTQSQSSSQTQSRTPSPTRSQTPTSSQSQSASLTLSPSQVSTGSATQTPSVTLTSSQSLTASSTMTASYSLTPSRTGSLSQLPTPSTSRTPTPSQTQTTSLSQSTSQVQSTSQEETASGTQSSSQMHTASMTGTPSSTQTTTLTQSATLTRTPSTSREPYALLFSASPQAFSSMRSWLGAASTLKVSDSLVAAPLTIALSRCPTDSGGILAVNLVCSVSPAGPRAQPDTAVVVPDTLLLYQSFPVALVSTIPCDPSSEAPVVLGVTNGVGAYFGTSSGEGALVCRVTSTETVGQVLAVATQPVVTEKSLWPLWDDAIIVTSFGFMRSPRLGLSINSTHDLLRISRSGDVLDAVHNLTAVLATAQLLWARVALPRPPSSISNNNVGLGFSVTLTGSTVVVLRASQEAFRVGTTATLGMGLCSRTEVSTDGRWIAFATPSANSTCAASTLASGSTSDCGYVTLQVNTTDASEGSADGTLPSSRPLGIALPCPPFCPGALSLDIDSNSGAAVPHPLPEGKFGFARNPPIAGSGTPPLVLTNYISSTTSAGIYYALACEQAGIYTDPATGACSNVSDPSSLQCAYGAGEQCRLCPSSALCPGGFRLWPRAGYWAAYDTSGTVTPCSAPDAESRCTSWSVALGATQCGSGYLQGSYLCGSCAAGYFSQDDGTCVKCPVLKSTWSRYSGLLYVLFAIIGAVAVVYIGLLLLVRFRGGTLLGGSVRMVDLGIWALLSAQVASNAATVSSPTLAPLLQSLYRSTAVLQLQGVLLPPACTGAYPFESQVSLMSIALGAWLICSAVYYGRRCFPRGSSGYNVASQFGRATLMLALVLYSNSVRTAVSLLVCASIQVTTRNAADLNGGEEIGDAATTAARGATTTVQVYAANPYFVCWAGSHRVAGMLAVITLALYVIALPPMLCMWTLSDPLLRRQRLGELDEAKAKLESRNKEIDCARGLRRPRCRCLQWGRREHRNARLTQPRDRATVERDGTGCSSENGNLQVVFNPISLRSTISVQSQALMRTQSSQQKQQQRREVLLLPQLMQRLNGGCEQSFVNPLQSLRHNHLQHDQRRPVQPLDSIPAPDPMLQPLLGDYMPSAWYTKFIDLLLLGALALLGALVVRPSVLGLIVTKAAVSCSLLFAVCCHVVIVRPYAPLHAWKNWVRALLLLDSVGCVLLNAANSAQDAGLNGPHLRVSIFVGSYILFSLFCVTLAVLLWQFGLSMYAGAEAEQHDLKAAESASAAQAIQVHPGTLLQPRPPATPRSMRRTQTALHALPQETMSPPPSTTALQEEPVRMIVNPIKRRAPSMRSRSRRVSQCSADLFSCSSGKRPEAARAACVALRDALFSVHKTPSFRTSGNTSRNSSSIRASAVTQAAPELTREEVESAISAFSGALAMHSTDIDLVQTACEGLRAAAKCGPAATHALHSAEPLRRLLAALQHHGMASSGAVAKASCGALAVIATTTEGAAAIVEAGGVALLVGVLRASLAAQRDSKSEGVGEAAPAVCRVLAELSAHEHTDVLQALTGSEVIEVLAGVLAAAAAALASTVTAGRAGRGDASSTFYSIISSNMTAAAYAAQTVAAVTVADDALVRFLAASGTASIVSLLRTGLWHASDVASASSTESAALWSAGAAVANDTFLQTASSLHASASERSDASATVTPASSITNTSAIMKRREPETNVMVSYVTEAMLTLSTRITGAAELYRAGAVPVLLMVLSAANNAQTLSSSESRRASRLVLWESACWALRGFVHDHKQLSALAAAGAAATMAAVLTVCEDEVEAEHVDTPHEGTPRTGAIVVSRIIAHARALLQELSRVPSAPHRGIP